MVTLKPKVNCGNASFSVKALVAYVDNYMNCNNEMNHSKIDSYRILIQVSVLDKGFDFCKKS